MLPSQGLFRSIPCPFFLAGLCERPHCAYRHCRSDIRIDRKLESESVDRPVDDDEVEIKSKAPDSSGPNKPASSSSSRRSSSSIDPPRKLNEPVVANPDTKTSLEQRCSSSNSSKNSSSTSTSPLPVPPKSSSNDIPQESKPERLKLESSSSSKSESRKRSRDSEDSDSGKRRKVSGDSKVEGENMGEIYSKLKSVTEKITGSSSGRDGVVIKDIRDIDLLVAHIEGKDHKELERTKEHHRYHHHKKHKHRRRESETEAATSSKSSSSSNKDKDKQKDKERSKDKERDQHHRSSSTSHRKENRSSKEGSSSKGGDEHRKEGKKEERSSGDGHHQKRRKDSLDDSTSSASSPKDHKRIRKSSNNEVEDALKSPDKHQNNSSGNRKRKDSGSSLQDKTSPKKGGDHCWSPWDKAEVLRSKKNSIDVSNRFNALAEHSADEQEEEPESAYNSDVFDESLEFNYGGSDSEDDPDMVARECLEMFENYKPDTESSSGSQSPEKKSKEPEASAPSASEEGFCVVGKKRVAHPNATSNKCSSSPGGSTTVSTPPPPKKPIVTSKNLQDMLAKRYESQSKSSNVNAQNGFSTPSSNSPSASSSSSVSPKATGKFRIAHVPNAGKLAQKPVVPPASSRTAASSSGGSTTPGQPGSLTYSQTAAKGTKREAHKPSAAVITKAGPVIFRDAPNKSSKIPHNTRQCIMDKMYAEYSRICNSADEAFQMTVDKENELLGKCSSKQVYYSFGISIISGLRKSSKQDQNGGGVGNRVISHQQILTGSLEAKNCSVRTVKKDGALPQGSRLYKALRKYLMTEQQLVDNGYPRPHPSGEKGRAYAKPRPGEENSMTLTSRICDRCKKRYMTTEEGDHLVSEVCNYHWGRKFSTVCRGARETNYICCSGDDDKIGCVTAICHVSRSPVPISSQKGFVQAINPEGPEELMGENEWDIIGIDCEMVYTTHGNELARVTIVRVDSTVLYDEIIRPTHRVLDCNSRFSGITFDDLDKAKWSITDVQAVLLSKIRPNTIIIGHSLESDLIALRLKHDCVIDTTLLYPHRMGPPKKRALKTLSAEVLKKVIQESESGHDSCEDAQIAVELVLAKLKADSCK